MKLLNFNKIIFIMQQNNRRYYWHTERFDDMINPYKANLFHLLHDNHILITELILLRSTGPKWKSNNQKHVRKTFKIR